MIDAPDPHFPSESRGVSPKARQWLLLGGLLVGAFALLYVLFALTDSPKTSSRPASAKAPVTTHVQAPGAQVDARDRWIGEAGNKVAEHDQKLSRQEQLNAEITARIETLQKQIELARLVQLPQAGTSAAVPPTLPRSPVPPGTSANGNAAYPPASALPPLLPPLVAPQPTSSTATQQPFQSTPQPISNRGEASASLGAVASLTPPPRLLRLTVTAAAARSDAASGSTSAASTSPQTPARAPSIATYLPVSFTRAVLLGGLDAPTGGQAQNNPQPVLLRLADHAFLPNRFRGAIKECLVIGAGYGDISAERAYIRTENLSCVRHDGRTLEVKIRGSVFGEDGKVGVRGRLVSKQGQMLANALIAGVVAGIGQGFQARATTAAISPLGTISTVADGKELEAGLSTGVGRAMDRLAQYYITLAEKTFPVIEVDAGRSVDVVLTQGVALDVPLEAAEPSDESSSGEAVAHRSTHTRPHGDVDED